jgi:hypothetical protein
MLLPIGTHEPEQFPSRVRFWERGPLLLVLLALLAWAPSGILQADLGPEPFSMEFREFAGEAAPPLPDPSVFPVQLVIDDDSAEAVFGLDGASARQFLWFNRFDNPGSGGFRLEEIWVLFPAGGNVPVGGSIELVVLLDPDGDPANGATLLASYADVVQVADGNTFSIYTIPSLAINDPGDILIGVVNRYFQTGIDPPPTRPAAFDVNVSQDRSYFALWAGDAPSPPDLSTATLVDLLGGAAAGNFMIRGFGIGAPVVEVPTLSHWALVLMALVLGALSYRRLELVRKSR